MSLDVYASPQIIRKHKLKLKVKSWIILGLQNSIFVTKKLLVKFIINKDPLLKVKYRTKYKNYRNLQSTLLKKNKQDYHSKYFKANWKKSRTNEKQYNP